MQTGSTHGKEYIDIPLGIILFCFFTTIGQALKYLVLQTSGDILSKTFVVFFETSEVLLLTLSNSVTKTVCVSQTLYT